MSLQTGYDQVMAVAATVGEGRGSAPALNSSAEGTLIRPPRKWEPINVAEMWKYRELLGFLVWRDVKVRYKQTALGVAWAVLQPAMMMVVFTIFFKNGGQVDSGKDLPYPLFVYAGLTAWTFFSTAVSSAGNSVVGSERLISKIYFPRLSIPFACVGASLVDFCIAFTLLLGLMGWYFHTGEYHGMPWTNMLFMPVILIPIILTAMGVGTILAALNVTYRDFKYITPFLMQIWMFATPSVYSVPKVANDWIHKAMLLNPMSDLIAAFRAACCGGAIEWNKVAVAATFAVVLFIAGCFYFRRTEYKFADLI